jgi:hypothetical protein
MMGMRGMKYVGTKWGRGEAGSLQFCAGALWVLSIAERGPVWAGAVLTK